MFQLTTSLQCVTEAFSDVFNEVLLLRACWEVPHLTDAELFRTINVFIRLVLGPINRIHISLTEMLLLTRFDLSLLRYHLITFFVFLSEVHALLSKRPTPTNLCRRLALFRTVLRIKYIPELAILSIIAREFQLSWSDLFWLAHHAMLCEVFPQRRQLFLYLWLLRHFW